MENRMLAPDLVEDWWHDELQPAQRNGWREWMIESGGEECPPDDLRATLPPKHADPFAGADCHLHPVVLELLAEHATEPSER
jgi:hypothetical protein